MAGKTINSLYHSGISLSPGDNPVLITGGEGFVVYNQTAITGDNSQAWTITNQGTVDASFFGTGISLAGADSFVDNSGAGAIIHGYYGGVALTGGGTLLNDGTIIADHGHAAVLHGGTVTNNATGLIQAWDTAISLETTGTVVNAGTLTGYVGVRGADGSRIFNTGTINSYSNIGVDLTGGGGVTNGTTAASGARIAGGKYGVHSSSGFATVANFGTIAATSAYGLAIGAVLGAAGLVTNSGTAAAISGRTSAISMGHDAVSDGTVINDGSITSDGVAIRIVQGGTVINGSGTASAALISGAVGIDVGHFYNVYDAGGPATIVNAGTIIGTAASGIHLSYGGTIGNTGSIQGGTYGINAAYLAATVSNQGAITGGTGAGVVLSAGGVVINGTGTALGTASITGATGVEIGHSQYTYPYGYTSGGSGSVVNAGTIIGTAAAGVLLHAGGSVANFGSIQGYHGIVAQNDTATVTNDGTITSMRQGVRLLDAAGTVTNTGTITGGYGHAVYLQQGGSVSNSGTLIGLYSGSGIRISNQAGIVTNTGSIDGHGGGIRLTGGGTVSNLGTGAVVSGFNRGVAVYGGAVINEGSITSSFDAVSIDGGGYVGNSGSAALIKGGTGVRGGGAPLTIVNAGTIEGTGGNAIYLQQGGAITNSGMLVRSVRSYGDTTLGNTGTISETGGTAVEINASGTVTNGAPAGTAALIATLYGDGVRIGDSTTSAGTVTNDGTITGGTLAGGPRSSYGPFGSGVRLLDGGTLTNGTGGNTAASISGSNGVYAGHYYFTYLSPGDFVRGFTGAATILNAGTITGVDRSGVGLYGGGSVTNTGLINGYTSGVAGAWHPIVVVNDGTITATGTYGSSYGIGVSSSNYSGDKLTNGSPTNHDAVIEGASYGVYFHDGATLDNFGTISAASYSAVEISSGTVTNGEGGLIAGGQHGVDMLRPGAVANDGTITGTAGAGVKLARGSAVTNGTANAAALITGTIGVQQGYFYVNAYGTYASAPAIVVNAGSITGFATGPIGYGFPGDSGIGILLESGGSIDNGGYVYGDFSGIVIDHAAGTVSNTGTVASQYYGIRLKGVAGSVTNQGTITGGIGIALEAGGTVANLGTGAAIAGQGFGIGVYARGSAAATVTNEGTIAGFFAVYLHGGGSLANSGTASLLTSPGGIGVRAGFGNPVDITNDGTIAGYEAGIRMSGGGTVTNGGTANAAAAINGYQTGIYARSAPATVINYGAITSDTGTAIYLDKGGSVTNAAGGTIAGDIAAAHSGGIFSYDTATVTNAGSITGFYGVALAGGSIANIGTAARISGNLAIFGAPGYAPGAVSVTNEGTIDGSIFAIGLLSGGNVTNSGTASIITGTGAGIVIEATGTILNEGTIRAYGYGINAGYGRVRITNGTATDTAARIEGHFAASFAGASGVVDNFGTIAGYASGVAFLDRLGVVNNRGLIEAPGGSVAGYGVVLGKGGRLANSGTITGTYGVVAGYPCGCSQGGAVTVTNSGTIIGTGGIAVQLGDFDDTVAVKPGAAFDGAVIAGAGNDTLVLLGAGGVGTIAGLGADFTGFETIALPTSGSRWSLAGTNTLDDGSTLDLAGRLTVAGALQVPGTLHIDGPGTLSASLGGGIEIGSAGGAPAGRITIDADGRLVGNGVLRGAVTNRGAIEVAGGTLTVLNNVGGPGTIAITAGAVLDARANLPARHLVFAGAGTDETLVAAKAETLTGIIAGFGDHDVIDLTGFAADPALTSFAGNVLTLHALGGPDTVMLHFVPGYGLGDFVVAPLGPSGTSITHS